MNYSQSIISISQTASYDADDSSSNDGDEKDLYAGSSNGNSIFVRKDHPSLHCCNNSSQGAITPPMDNTTPIPNERSRLILRSSNSYTTTNNNNNNISSYNTNKTNNTNTEHAQVLVLALAFAAVWSPQNCMAPNLTQMAESFHFSENQRDIYLGANIALATGVLSIPLSAGLGFVADVVHSRKTLLALTVAMTGLSSLLTGLSSTNYSCLYVSRFVCGGCMAGALPIAFSLLGDFFHAADRNAASSGLTVAMGIGILLGQMYAGKVGPSHGWPYPFYVCGVFCLVCSLLVQLFVSDPVRGGKELALQEILKSGKSYDRKLTLQGFWHAMIHNNSNFILMLQGFFTSVPWGIIFVFLNDYLSQECGMSVPDATFLLLLFGIGAALGGILGGWIGSRISAVQLFLLPLFMAASTLLGILPFFALLNGKFQQSSFYIPCLYAFLGGLIANLPSVNIRPVLISVNLPETRGATLTAANLVVSLARGIGPLMLTSCMSITGWTRQLSFEVLLVLNWLIGAILLLFLARTLPSDQQWVEQELIAYAEESMQQAISKELSTTDNNMFTKHDSIPIISSEPCAMFVSPQLLHPALSRSFITAVEEEEDIASLVGSIDDPLMLSANAAMNSFRFLNYAIREIGDGLQREWGSARNILATSEQDVPEDIIHLNDSFMSPYPDKEEDYGDDHHSIVTVEENNCSSHNNYS